MASASGVQPAGVEHARGVVSAVVPILTTTLRAVRTASRCGLRHGSLVPSVCRGARGGPPCARRRRRRSVCSSRMSVPRPDSVTSTPAGVCGSQSNVTSPMVTAQPGLGAQLEQLVLDAEPGQPVAEVADGLVVVEIGLADPALGPAPRTMKPPLAVGSTREAGLVDRRSAGSPGARGALAAARRGRPTTISPSANVSGRKPSRLTAETSNTGQPAGLELVADEVGQFAGLRHVDLVEHHRPRPSARSPSVESPCSVGCTRPVRPRARRGRRSGRGRAPGWRSRGRAPAPRSARCAAGSPGRGRGPRRRRGSGRARRRR